MVKNAAPTELELLVRGGFYKDVAPTALEEEPATSIQKSVHVLKTWSSGQMAV